MSLVDEAVNLVQGAHHVQVEDGECEDIADFDLAMNEHVDGAGEDENVEEALVERLAATEKRHLEVMADFLGSLPLGRPRDAADLLAMCVGGSHVVDSREQLDDGAVHHLARPHQVEPDSFLGDELPDRQRERNRHDPDHHQRDPGLLGQSRGEGEDAGEEGGDEIQEADPEKPDEPIRTAVDPSVQGSHLVLGQDREIHLHEVGDKPNAHILVDARTGILDQVPAEHVHGLAHQVSQAEQSQVNTRSLHDRAGGQALMFYRDRRSRPACP